MINVFQAGAKYLTILFFAVFVYASFRAQRDVPEERKRGTLNLQRVLVLLVHFLCFMCIGVQCHLGSITDMKVTNLMILAAAELAYLAFMMYVLPRIINISKGLNNVMCMLIAVGMVFQARLDWDGGLKHFLYILGCTLVFVFFQVAHRKINGIRNLTWVYCILGLALLIAVYVFAQVSRGAKVSIDLGFVSIQPFEFVKILFVMFIAAAFNKSNSLKTVAITAGVGAVYIIILVMCSELGTALILAVVFVLMVYVATKKSAYVFAGAAAFAIACVAAYILFSHVRTRVDVWLNPWSDIDNKGYQITQSLFAIGTGGWFGSGLGNGRPQSVPMVANDFIFSAIAEELGTMFGIFLIILCLCLVLMTFRIAIRISLPFYKLLAFGLGSAYGFQVFLTIGGAIKFIPSTGINLPFISSGGSSILASMVMLGIIQALYVISEADARREAEEIADVIMRMEELGEDEDMEEYLACAPEKLEPWRVVRVDPDDIEMY